MTAAPTPSAEELDALEALLRPGSQGTCAMCDQVCDTAADAIKALRQQVAELEGEAMTRSQDDGKLEREIERLQGQVAELRSAMAWESVDAVIAERDAAVKLRDEWCAEYTKARDELTASRERVERLQTGIREVIPEIVKYVGHIPDRKFTIGNVIRKLEALAATAGEVKP